MLTERLRDAGVRVILTTREVAERCDRSIPWVITTAKRLRIRDHNPTFRHGWHIDDLPRFLLAARVRTE